MGYLAVILIDRIYSTKRQHKLLVNKE